ncbi:unnamed protein product [Rhizophagus irregularis]|nr:unnamed protein product [Rhizophagus irregularis]
MYRSVGRRKRTFPNKKDRIIQHFKKCDNFFAKTNEEKREKIFAILQPNNNDVLSIIPQKRSYSISSQTSQVSLASSSSHKVNKPEAKKLFDFLNPFLKLPDRHVLGGDILKQVVADSDKAMETAIKENPVASNGKPYVWKAVDISSERENYTAVIEKTEAMLTDLLKTQQALQILAINFKPPIVETHWRQGEALTLPCEIFEIIDSSIFWDHITLINNILEPYCKLLNVLQCDKARLFQLMYYYRAWSGKESKCILREFDDFWLAKYPFDLESYRQFNDDIWRYWCYVSVSTNELGLVAYRIFSICVNAASVERLWSCMDFLQTKQRNRLMSSKALQMSKLRADIIYGHHLHNNPILIEPTLNIDDANETDTNQNPGNLNGLENNRGNDPAVNLETNPKPIEVDYDSDDEAFEPQLENNFSEYLQGLTEMLKEEENAEIDEVDEESNTSLDDITHPANDTSAKWELITLFNNNIDVSLLF